MEECLFNLLWSSSEDLTQSVNLWEDSVKRDKIITLITSTNIAFMVDVEEILFISSFHKFPRHRSLVQVRTIIQICDLLISYDLNILSLGLSECLIQ